MAEAKFIPNEVEDVAFEEYEVRNTPMTSADIALDSLINALNDVSGTATVAIYRQNGTGKEALTFLDSFAADKFSPDDLLLHLKNQYGSGNYRIHVKENGKLRANKHVSIEAPNVSRETSSNGDINALIQFMQQQQQQMLQAIREQQHSSNNEDVMLERMLKYKALFGGETSQQSPRGFKDVLETVEGLKMLGINVGGIQPEKEEGFTDILDRALPMVTALIQSNQNQQPQSQPQPQPQYKPNQQPRGETNVNFALKMGLKALVNAAKKKSPTGPYADLVLDQFPQDKIELLFSPDALAQLQKIEPAVSAYLPWFEDVLEHVKGMCGQPSKYDDEYQNEDDDLNNDNETVINGETQKDG